ncbi:globin domain-containing protein [Marinactinospora thermotolerans]|uniref:Hemoglobin-like flavoprotein n=1 Tax=Marinactinospora thermotolerans DSM 45154 TaxID=1122192 RepID=A0A1T4NQ47_9ACTN|nr:globin domain-containing protein [Marinactinospora thermotolerans]SJZ80918.1 Hemoglobin-like flavoprotein [Marinactinospora thermotolerans DSM 45154]
MQPRSAHEVPLPDPAVVEAVRLSCADLPRGSTRLADLFYDHLFALVPETRSMFPADMGPQRERMAHALVEVVDHLDRPVQVRDFLHRLGRHHHRIGVRPEHYPHVGRALVRAVADIAPTWTSSMSSAWVLVYEWIAATMLVGAREAAEEETARAPLAARGRHSRAARPAGPLP